MCPPFLTRKSAQSKEGMLSDGIDEKTNIATIIAVAGSHNEIVIFLTNFMIKPSKAYYVFVTQHALEIEGY